jgi:glycosyltransferase involved in cell wall biosynthesis
MNVSVVLAMERPTSHLDLVLSALRRQTHRAIEVVLVTGSDAGNLAPHTDSLKVIVCPDWQPARAKNRGAVRGAGDVIAFLDPFAVPEVSWLAELVRGYSLEEVAGVGGLVRNTGDQDPCYTADRLGNRLAAVPPPYWAYQIPNSDRYVCLHAGNASFRRRCFLDVGGFDEAIGADLHQTDLCLRLTDRGCLLQPWPRALVYQIADVVCPDEPRVDGVRNRVRFGVRSANPLTTRDDVLRHHRYDTDDLDRAAWEGIALAVQDSEPASLSGEATAFLAFPTLEPDGNKLTACFTCKAFPPTSSNPDGRHTWNLARALAEKGHTIHLFVSDAVTERTDFEQGVWIHRLSSDPAPGVAMHRALTCLARNQPLDLVVASDCAGIYCLHDPAISCVLSLTPTFNMRLEDWPAVQRTPDLEQTLYREQLMLHSARQVIAPGPGLLRRVRQLHGAPFAPACVHFCPPVVRDRVHDYPHRPSSAVRLLFVGALERESGADLFLQAAVALIQEGHDLEAQLTGDGDLPTHAGPSWRTVVNRMAAALPELRRRVSFLGELSEEGLVRALAECDVVCLPYRVDSATLPCLEAMMFGKPVVASDLSSARELLGFGGVLCRKGDAGALADRLRELLGDAALRHRLGTEGRAAYETHFAFDRVVETTLSTFSRIAGEVDPEDAKP